MSAATPNLPGGPGTAGGPVSDINAPQLPQSPQTSGGVPSDQPMMQTQPPVPTGPNQTTTKPRQIPGGGGMPGQGPGQMPPPGAAPGAPDTGSGVYAPGGQDFSPMTNGGDIGAGADQAPPNAAPETGGDPTAPSGDNSRVSMVMYDVLTTNPDVPDRVAYRIARRVVDDYLAKEAGGAWSHPSSGWQPQSFFNVNDGPIQRRFNPENAVRGPAADRVQEFMKSPGERTRKFWDKIKTGPPDWRSGQEPDRPQKPKRRRPDNPAGDADQDQYREDSADAAPEPVDLNEHDRSSQPRSRSAEPGRFLGRAVR